MDKKQAAELCDRYLRQSVFLTEHEERNEPMTENILNTGYTRPELQKITDPDKQLIAYHCYMFRRRDRMDLRQATTDAVDAYGWQIVAEYFRSVEVVPEQLFVLEGELRTFADQHELDMAHEHAARFKEGRVLFHYPPIMLDGGIPPHLKDSRCGHVIVPMLDAQLPADPCDECEEEKVRACAACTLEES